MTAICLTEQVSMDAVRAYLLRLVAKALASQTAPQVPCVLTEPSSQDADDIDLGTSLTKPLRVRDTLRDLATDPTHDAIPEIVIGDAEDDDVPPYPVGCSEEESFEFGYAQDPAHLAHFLAAEGAEWLDFADGDDSDEQGHSSDSPTSSRSKRMFQRMQEQASRVGDVAGRVGDVVDETAARAHGKVRSTWNASDAFAERYAQQAETVVNRKAAYVADRSIAACRSVDSTVRTRSERIGEYVGTKFVGPMVDKADKYKCIVEVKAERAADKATQAAKYLEAKTGHAAKMVQAKTTPVVDKAKALSQAARNSTMEKMNAMSRSRGTPTESNEQGATRWAFRPSRIGRPGGA